MKFRLPSFHWDRFLRKARGRHGKIKRITNDSESAQRALLLLAATVIVFSVLAIVFHDLFFDPNQYTMPRQFRSR